MDILKLTGCKNWDELKDCIVITGDLSTDPSNLDDIDRKKIKF